MLTVTGFSPELVVGFAGISIVVPAKRRPYLLLFGLLSVLQAKITHSGVIDVYVEPENNAAPANHVVAIKCNVRHCDEAT